MSSSRRASSFTTTRGSRQWDAPRKMILLGDKGAGKSTLFYRLQYSQFTAALPREKTPNDICVKDVVVDSRLVKVGARLQSLLNVSYALSPLHNELRQPPRGKVLSKSRLSCVATTSKSVQFTSLSN